MRMSAFPLPQQMLFVFHKQEGKLNKGDQDSS